MQPKEKKIIAIAACSETEMEMPVAFIKTLDFTTAAIRFITWLGVSFAVELLVHGKPAEVNAAALDALFGIDLEALAIEERTGCKTGVGGNSCDTDGFTYAYTNANSVRWEMFADASASSYSSTAPVNS